MRRLTVILAVLALLGLALPASAHTARVTNGNDSGPGSLRAALESGRSPIVIWNHVGDIEIGDGLVWASRKDLVIRGTGQTITDLDGSASGALLTVSRGADTSIQRLGFQGPGGFDIANKGGASGIDIAVPADAKGTVKVDLEKVSIADVGLHGLHVDDLTNASRASIALRVHRVTVSNSGIGGFDQDGIRVDEAGKGSISFRSIASDFDRAGADGVELDERGAGDVRADVKHTDFTHNGNYCSFRFEAAEIEGLLGDQVEEVSELEAIIAATALDTFLTLFDANEEECLEIVPDDDLLEIAIDIDDAFDIDEADHGSISSKVAGGSLIGNEDEGLDYDEAGPGGISGRVEGTLAADNTDEAIKFSELDEGHLDAKVSRVSAAGQDLEFEEFGDGSLHSSIRRSTFDDISLVEEDAGSSRNGIARSTVDDIEGEETADGDLRLRIDRSTVGGDIELTQEPPGEGTLRIRDTDFAGTTDLTGVTEI